MYKRVIETYQNNIDINKKSILFIGTNDMGEINNYVNTYNKGIFIEALPNIFNQLKKKLDETNKLHNTKFIAVNSLVTSKKGQVYNFNIFNNNGASSSIYKPNNKNWKWNNVKVTDTIQLTSTTIYDILDLYNWNNKKYDVVLDVQGAELEVLKGFGENNLNNIGKLTIEISNKKFYEGGVLFKELDSYLQNKNFKLISNNINCDHCDAIYIKIENYESKSNSQLSQDLKVLDYFNNKKGGFYIELGAHDGIHISNTSLLEKEFGWTGILIEPVNSTFEKLLVNRPNNINSNDVIYSIDGKEVIFEEKSQSVLSGIKDDLGKHKDTEKNIEYKKITKTLTTLLNENNATNYIDYLSLDTEGSELEILKGIDFEKYKIGYIDIEHNFEEPRRTNMKELLISKGYTYLGGNRWDDIYILI
jgi:FkbM family methyltransferase